MNYNEDDYRPSLISEMNKRSARDMNETFGRSQLTHYYDINDRCVCVGDMIRFLWWVPTSDGLQREEYYIGKIVKRKGKLVFRYKDNLKVHERRLDALNFDSTMEWEIINH